MVTPEIIASPPSEKPVPRRSVRIEYLGFQSVGEHREYRLATYGPDAPTEHRFLVANSAFGAGRLRLQDGPDVCFQKLLRAVTAGEPLPAGTITIDEADLTHYREAHTHVAKHRTRTPSANPRPAYVPPPPPRARVAPRPAPVVVVPSGPPPLEEGQRVSHAVFGAGVTTSSEGGHTVVRFDTDGPKTFVTSMVELEVLSAPHTWQTTPRGKNKPR
jgi:hypothetical protein